MHPLKSSDLLTTLIIGTKIRAELNIAHTSDNAHPPELEYPSRSDNRVILIRHTHFIRMNPPPSCAMPPIIRIEQIRFDFPFRVRSIFSSSLQRQLNGIGGALIQA